jgi:hypothetical protein
MKRDRSVYWLLLLLMLTGSPEALAQTNIPQLNVDGIAKAIGKEGDLTARCIRSLSQGLT